MLCQPAVAAVVEHGQRIDRAVQRQFAPQPGEDVSVPLMGNVRRLQIVQPDRRQRICRIAQPVEAVAGKHHAPIAIAKRALGAGGADATRVRHARGDGVLTAEAVLQENQFGVRREAGSEAGHAFFGIVGLARDQQTPNRLGAVRGFAGNCIGMSLSVFYQG